jgi:hypothetical protein
VCRAAQALLSFHRRDAAPLGVRTAVAAALSPDQGTCEADAALIT